jgi:hypothetical protein
VSWKSGVVAVEGVPWIGKSRRWISSSTNWQARTANEETDIEPQKKEEAKMV